MESIATGSALSSNIKFSMLPLLSHTHGSLFWRLFLCMAGGIKARGMHGWEKRGRTEDEGEERKG